MVQEQDIRDLLEESDDPMTDSAIAYELADTDDSMSQVKGQVRSTLVRMMNERSIISEGLKYNIESEEAD